MKTRYFVWVIVFFVFVGFLAEKKIFAGGSSTIKLSYRVLEGSSDEQALNMLVNLRVANKSSTPIHDFTAYVINTNNVTIDDVDKIRFSSIGAGETLLSSESFNVTVDIRLPDQEQPQSQVTWEVEYFKGTDLVVEEISF